MKIDKIMIQPKFEELYYFEGGLALAKINGLWGAINKSGRFVIPPQFKDYGGMAPFRYHGEEFIRIYQDGFWGFINTRGEFVIRPQFSDIRPFYNGIAAARQNDLWGFINTRGEFVVRPQFSSIEHFSDGVEAVSQNGLWGFVNTQGKIVIKPQFSRVKAFSDGAAAVKRAMPPDNRNWFEKLGGVNEPPTPRYGYIDKSGKFITPQLYLEAEPFKKGLAAVSMGIAKR